MSKIKTGVILGMGEFGFHLAKSLSKSGCNVIAVDKDKTRINLIKDYVSKAIVADVVSSKVLEQIVPVDADFVANCIGNIEASMIASLYLKEIGVRKIVVKSVTNEHEKILKMLNIEDVVFPERDMADRVSAKLMSNNLLDYLPFSDEYSIAEVASLRSMEGKTLKELNFRKTYNMTVIAVKELVPPQMIFTPPADFTIKMSDILVVIGKKEDIDAYNLKEK